MAGHVALIEGMGNVCEALLGISQRKVEFWRSRCIMEGNIKLDHGV
jgi:hypothetical protein